MRQALEKQNESNRTEGKPEINAGPLITLAEQIMPALRTAEWRDKAEAALADLDELDLRDLRSVVVASDAAARDEETRALAEQLRVGLAARVEAEHAAWLAEIDETLTSGRVVRALRVSSRPPKAGAPFPPELATRLTDETAKSLTPETGSDRFGTVLDALAYSPVRGQVTPQGIPAEPSDELLAVVRKLASTDPRHRRAVRRRGALGAEPLRPRSTPQGQGRCQLGIRRADPAAASGSDVDSSHRVRQQPRPLSTSRPNRPNPHQPTAEPQESSELAADAEVAEPAAAEPEAVGRRLPSSPRRRARGRRARDRRAGRSRAGARDRRAGGSEPEPEAEAVDPVAPVESDRRDRGIRARARARSDDGARRGLEPEQSEEVLGSFEHHVGGGVAGRGFQPARAKAAPTCSAHERSCAVSPRNTTSSASTPIAASTGPSDFGPSKASVNRSTSGCQPRRASSARPERGCLFEQTAQRPRPAIIPSTPGNGFTASVS